MTRAETGVRLLLAAKLAELEASGRNREAVARERSADILEDADRATACELVVHSLDRDAATRREIRAALDRLEEGGYGICLECEEPIGQKRLAAIPWASLCVRCQTVATNSVSAYTMRRAA